MASSASCPQLSDDQFGPRVNLLCRSFDFTLLFEDAIFAALPAALLLLLLPSRLRSLHSTPSKVGSYRLAIWKLSLLTSLFTAQLLFLAYRSQTAVIHTKISLPADTMQALATAAAIYASFMEDQRSVRPSDILALYFSMSSVLSIARLRSLWIIPYITVCRCLAAMIFILTVLTLLVECLTKANFLRPQYQQITKEQAQSLWGRTFFTYNIPFFRAGFSSILSLEDVPDVDLDLQGQVAGRKLRDAWATTNGKHRLVKAAFTAYPWFFLYGILPRLLLAVFTFAQPFLITATIQFMQHPVNEDTDHYGGALIGAFVLLYVGLATTTSIYWRQTYRFITMLRSGLISAIYDQTLLLQAQDLGDATAITLMGTDVERIVVNLKNIHESWASILEVGIAIWLLERQLWVACVVPVVICFGSVLAMMPLSSRSGGAQKQWIERLQKRLAVTSCMLRDMKLVQMLGLSGVLERTVSQLRRIEINTSMRFRKLLIWQIAISNIPTDLAPFATFAIYSAISVLRGNETLLAAKAFTALALVSLLTTPLLIFCQAMPALFQVVACFGRIEEYLSKEPGNTVIKSQSRHVLESAIELQDRREPRMSSRPLVSLENATVSRPGNGTAILHEVTLNINRGITMIIGPVGSGKSTLLETMLGENIMVSGTATVILQDVAYCAQSSWIQNATIRQNILGPLDYDEKHYEFTISACGLERDLDTIPGGDSSVTGSSGVALSGGQKQRIALARAVYSKLEVVVLDNIFSGLDSRTTMLIRDRLFGSSGHFRKAGRSVIFTTNSNSMFELVDNIIVLDQGRIVAYGSYDQIVERSPKIASRFFSSAQAGAVPESTEEIQEVRIDGTYVTNKQAQTDVEEKVDLLRQTGSWSVYKYYAQKAGYLPLILTIAFTSLECVCTAFGALWLQWWVEANERQPNQHLGLYLGIYGMIFALSMVGMLGGCWALIIKILNNTSLNMHLELLHTALRAPIVHLQKIDVGAITNRFSQDLELIDMALPSYSIQFLTAAITCVIRLVILCAIGRYLAATIPFLFVILYLVQAFYLRTSRQVRLLDIEAKAPLYTHFTETIQGISSIHAFAWGSAFQSKSQKMLNQSQKPVYMLFCIQQWLTLVLDLVVGGIAVILIAIIVTWKDSFSAVQVGVALNLLLSFNSSIAQAIKMWTMMEMSIGAVTRVQQFVRDTPVEEQDSNLAHPLPGQWPSHGAIQFYDIVAGYSADNLTLRNISITFAPGTKTFICGPSGSGKTSLLMSLLSMLPRISGHITIDGIDTSSLPPRSLREAINVIPQDAFFMPGSLRTNLDPKQLTTDNEIRNAVTKVGLWDKVHEAGGLDHEFDSEKWSVGQKQLLALARAVLLKCKILVLDEAMSSVDFETEMLMQRMIEDEFGDCTVLAVAHRFNSLEWFDRVVVVKEGEIVEQGSFEELVGKGGEFARLWRSDGARSNPV